MGRLNEVRARAAAISWERTPDREARMAPAWAARDARFSSKEERSAFYRRIQLLSIEARRRNIEARAVVDEGN